MRERVESITQTRSRPTNRCLRANPDSSSSGSTSTAGVPNSGGTSSNGGSTGSFGGTASGGAPAAGGSTSQGGSWVAPAISSSPLAGTGATWRQTDLTNIVMRDRNHPSVALYGPSLRHDSGDRVPYHHRDGFFNGAHGFVSSRAKQRRHVCSLFRDMRLRLQSAFPISANDTGTLKQTLAC